MKLLEHAVGTPGFSVVQTTTTETFGFYELTLTDVQCNGVFYRHQPRSGERPPGGQRVLRRDPAGPARRNAAADRRSPTRSRSRAPSTPADVGALVVLQRQNALTGNEWHRIDFGFVQSGGGFSIVHTFRVPGDANLRVLVRSQRRNSPSPSNVLSYEISQAQNPKLTISASRRSDPLRADASTISGTDARRRRPAGDAARPHRPPAGLRCPWPKSAPARRRRLHVRAPVAGQQHLLRGQRGRRHVHSAVLYEGVKDVLTATVSQDIDPRRAAADVLGLGGPRPHGPRDLPRAPERLGQGLSRRPGLDGAAGLDLLDLARRLRHGHEGLPGVIPGGPENEGAASPPFTITVTPAPLAALSRRSARATPPSRAKAKSESRSQVAGR